MLRVQQVQLDHPEPWDRQDCPVQSDSLDKLDSLETRDPLDRWELPEWLAGLDLVETLEARGQLGSRDRKSVV